MTEPVTVVEVGPRDGLQNECAVLSTEVKLAFVRALASAGLSRIEVAAFVRPDRVPAMADAAEVAAVAKDVVPDASALVPNRRGLDGALAAGLSSVAVSPQSPKALPKPTWDSPSMDHWSPLPKWSPRPSKPTSMFGGTFLVPLIARTTGWLTLAR